ncbi:MAG: ribulose-phosphate 3-epimerase [Bacilli bacterium]|nr:ribulose-phosphate 3-epimerase [Bacilli bacterium]
MIVAPSILACDFGNLEHEVRKMADAHAEFIHLDVMDGVFVPAHSLSAEIVSSIVTPAIKDTHLMVVDPKSRIKEFADAGSDIITFHLEACKDEEEVHDTIKLIHSYGKKAGLSIKPKTSVNAYTPFLNEIDLALVMSVEPGAGGQPFMMDALDKIAWLKEHVNQGTYIEVDGGINATTAPLCAQAGANVLVAGSYLYGHEDYEKRVRGLLDL